MTNATFHLGRYIKRYIHDPFANGVMFGAVRVFASNKYVTLKFEAQKDDKYDLFVCQSAIYGGSVWDSKERAYANVPAETAIAIQKLLRYVIETRIDCETYERELSELAASFETPK